MGEKTIFDRNPRLIGFRSLDGEAEYGVVDLYEGCPRARSAGRPTSVAAFYSAWPPGFGGGRGMERFGEWLPYRRFPTLGEGDTPLVPLNSLRERLGLGALWLKREAANPTGSHKDRMSPLCVARALEIGARGVVCASTGNAALSLAAYAAAAGVTCRVVATSDISEAYRRTIERMGAEVVIAPTFEERWPMVARMVRDAGWLPVTNYVKPAVGSNPFGVQGYRTIAFELHEAVGALDAVVVPTARGDLAWGIAEGYRALRSAGLIGDPMPRIIAVEPFPRLAAVLAGAASVHDEFPGRTRQASTSGSTTTDQARRAVAGSDGDVVVVDDGRAAEAQGSMARSGHDLELCSAAAIAAVEDSVRHGRLPPGGRVVVVATAASAREAPVPPRPAPEPAPPTVTAE